MATLQIAQRKVGDVVVLDLWGQITIGETSEMIRTRIKQLIEAHELKIVLHLGGVHQVDSSGLGSLVAVFSTVRKAGGNLTLVQLGEGLESLMVVTKLLTVFEIYRDEKAALESFQ